MSIKLYIDECAIRDAFVNELKSRCIDVTTTKEENKSGYSDEQQLDFAGSLGRTIFTYNVNDFKALHEQYISQGKRHSGIILANQSKFQRLEYTNALHNLINKKKARNMENNIEMLDFWF